LARESRGYPCFFPVGDAALTVEFGNSIEPEINSAVIALDTALNAAELDGIIETVPSYRSLLVCYDPLDISFHQLVSELRQLLPSDAAAPSGSFGTLWDVPVSYDAPFSEDLCEVAQRLELSEEKVVALHSEADYQVYAVGFAPGMPYLGGLPRGLHISRRLSPRPKVSAGAVIIGGVQAAIVPSPVPCAWYMLGQTPLRPFDMGRDDPFLFRPGDRMRFRRVDFGEFERLTRLPPNALVDLARVSDEK
jgi:KipI family sensor histidine kinase inhibitor